MLYISDPVCDASATSLGTSVVLAPIITSFSPDRTSSYIDEFITWTATVENCSEGALIHYSVYRDGERVYGAAGPSLSFSYKPYEAGNYYSIMSINDSSLEAFATSDTVLVANPPLNIIDFSVNQTSGRVGDTLTWTAIVDCTNWYVQYDFSVFRNGKLEIQRFPDTNTFSYYAGLDGEYYCTVTAWNGYDSDTATSATSVITGVIELYVTASSTYINLGVEPITWTVNAPNVEWLADSVFKVYKDGVLVHTSDATQDREYQYWPTEPGAYYCIVTMMDSYSQGSATSDTTIVSQPMTVTLSVEDIILPDRHHIIWTPVVENSSGYLLYDYRVYKDDVLIYGPVVTDASSVEYYPDIPGEYYCTVLVRDDNGEAFAKSEITVVGEFNPTTITSFVVDQTLVNLGTPITWTVTVENCSDHVNYDYAVFTGTVQLGPQVSLDTNSFSYTPAEPGDYYCIVYVNDNYGDDSATSEITTVIIPVLEDAPAAPAVAGKLLKEAGIKNKSAQYKSYIAQVAANMGPQTDFNGISKEDVDAYKEAVKEFLISIGAAIE